MACNGHVGTSTKNSGVNTGLVSQDRIRIGNRYAGDYYSGLLYAVGIFESPLSDDELAYLTDNPLSILAPRVLYVPVSSGGYTHPTLSNARMDPLSASGGIPKVDWAFS